MKNLREALLKSQLIVDVVYPSREFTHDRRTVGPFIVIAGDHEKWPRRYQGRNFVKIERRSLATIIIGPECGQIVIVTLLAHPNIAGVTISAEGAGSACSHGRFDARIKSG